MNEDSINKRRLTEDHLYDRVDENHAIRRTSLDGQKSIKDKVKFSSSNYSFLQFHHIIWKWATKNHGLTNTELSTLLYVFPLVSFTMADFFEAQKDMESTSPNTFFNLKKKGFISKWSSTGRTTHYVLSNKGISLVNRLHRMYMLEEEIPMSPRRNVIVRKSKKEDSGLVNLFKKFNEKIKKDAK